MYPEKQPPKRLSYRLLTFFSNRVTFTFFSVACLSLWFVAPASAVPANPAGHEVTQPDGTTFTMHLQGDEFFSWRETSEGYAVLKDPDDGFWKYAQPANDKAEFRMIKNARVGKSDPERIGMRKKSLPSVKLLTAEVEIRRRAIRGEVKEMPVATGVSGVSAPQSDALPLGGPPLLIPVIGNNVSIKNVVILACFSNHWDDVNGTVLPSYGRVDTNEFLNLFNQVGYTADGASGSVKDYYKEVSYGKLTLQSVVTMWVRLPREESYYHNNQGILASNAVEAADAAGFNFAQADTDGDGWVDGLDIIHSGYGEESTSNTSHVWSVKGSMPSVLTKDGVKMMTYHTEPSLRSSSGTGITRIGVICHETGHFFGLPDLYDYSKKTSGLGYWCLMASGSWNGTSGTSPAHFSAWCKVALGFAKADQIHSKAGFSLARIEDNAVVGMLRDGMSNDEFYLVENRAKMGFDNTSQINPGLLIYHVDQRSFNNDLGNRPHPAVKIEEADGNDSLGVAGGGTQAGDAWTSTSGLAGGWRDQTANTNTSAMLYQTASLYIRTNAIASYSYNRLSGFSAAGSNMTFNVQTLKTDISSQYALPTDFTVTWPVASEATKYELQEGVTVTLTNFFDGAESADELHSNWYVAGKTQRAVTNASYAGSCCYALLSQNYGGVQSLTLRKPFKVTANTVISFYLKSHIAANNGYIRCQISKDGGSTWNTLISTNGWIDTWLLRSYNYTAINAHGINIGDVCTLRFVMDVEYINGWSSFPAYGFALDNISITGTEIAGYGNWATLDSTITTNTYVIGAKTNGVYAYRAQAYANGAWQGFGNEGEITVGANHAPTFVSNPVVGAEASVGIAYAWTLTGVVSELDCNDTLAYSKISGPAWLSVAANGMLSGILSPGNVGTNTFTVRVVDRAGAYAEAQLNIFVALPASPLRNSLVAYLPFDADFFDYSGRGNHPAQSNVNMRATGCLGSGYVLTNVSYLSFGLAPDLHFSNTTSGNSNSFSVAFWAKIPRGSYTGEPPFIANKKWTVPDTNGWALASGPGTASSGFFAMNFKESNANARDFDSTNSTLTNGWHHYVVVFKRDPTRTAFTYVDGVEVDNRALFASGVNIDAEGLPVNIGQDGTGVGTRGSWVNGLARMDDFAFWRRSLSAAEVAAIYTAGTNGFAMGYAQAAPAITNLTASLVLNYGVSTNLSVSVYSAWPSTYQWRLSGSPIGGATGSTLSVTSHPPAASHDYDVIITNTYGATTSRVVTVQMKLLNWTLLRFH